MSLKPIIFVATPLAPAPGDPSPDANVKFAEETCRIVALAGGVPFAPHLLCTRFLDDGAPEERALGIEIGAAFMRVSKFAVFRLPLWRVEFSSGMLFEWQGRGALAIEKFCGSSNAEDFERQVRVWLGRLS